MLKIISLTITLTGILLLFLIYTYQTPIKIKSLENISLIENTKVSLSGVVTNERLFANSKLITLNNNTQVYISRDYKNLKGKKITIIGKISYYNNKTEINPTNIRLLS